MEPLRQRYTISPPASVPRGNALRIVASHDPLLAEFCERFAMPAGLVEELSFRGSEDALARYAAGGADVAGFHFSGGVEAAAIRRLLNPRRDCLVRFADREQGLIVPPGNPKKLTSFSDVARKHARFVNRQRGSGTRRLIDHLLRESGIAPDGIRGYGTEEHTHRAVAATVATGQADAGFGVLAAAAELGLDFVPVLHERYWLVMRQTVHGTPEAQKLLETLGGKQLARIGRRFAGYDFDGAGTVVGFEEAFR
jgi:putative molybdopterin biosynthesis protein